jgi:hypothetical protein
VKRLAEVRAQASGPRQGDVMSCLPVVRTHSIFVTVETDYRTFPMGKKNLG